MSGFFLYLFQDIIFAYLVYPFYLVYEVFVALFKGDLFPIRFEFGYTCGPAGGVVGYGNLDSWLVLIVIVAVVAIKLIFKKPKKLILFLVFLYVAVFLAGFVQILMMGSSPRFCM